MKPYQHHDPIADKGKAVPRPKRPTTHTYRGANMGMVGFEREEFLAARKQSVKPIKGKMTQLRTVFATVAALWLRAPKGGRR